MSANNSRLHPHQIRGHTTTFQTHETPNRKRHNISYDNHDCNPQQLENSINQHSTRASVGHYQLGKTIQHHFRLTIHNTIKERQLVKEHSEK